jgi:predicted phage terminase large subunit-like protein
MVDMRRIELRSTLYSESFAEYVRAAWQLLEPTAPLVTGFYFDAICEHLEAVTRGQIKRLIITIMPRIGKSSLVSVLWPTWEWARDNATSRWIFASYAEHLSVRDSVRRRNVLQSEWYRQLWGERVQLAADVNLKHEYASTNAGAMFSTWVGGGAGRGGKRLVLDDPHSPKKALSDAERETAIEYIRNVLISRLDNPLTDSIVMIMQRLHDNDAAGEFLADGGWTHLNLEATASERTTITMPITGKVVTREAGDILEPSRFPVSVLEQIKREMGTLAYSAQYQQQPAPRTGVIFNPNWWQYYDHDNPPQCDMYVISVDCAFKALKTSDYVAIHVYGMLGPRTYLLDRITEHLGFGATKQAIRGMLGRWWRVSHVLIEDAANGPAVIEELAREFPGIIPVRPLGGKVARAQASTADVEAGNCYLPEDAQWTLPLVLAFSKFPLDKHDDDVDAFTQVVNWKRSRIDYSMFNQPVNIYQGIRA